MAKSIFIAGALALTAIASQAFASEPVNVAPTRAVSVAGVDFRDPAAVKAFYAALNPAQQKAFDVLAETHMRGMMGHMGHGMMGHPGEE